jgi:hypothetical protein
MRLFLDALSATRLASNVTVFECRRDNPNGGPGRLPAFLSRRIKWSAMIGSTEERRCFKRALSWSAASLLIAAAANLLPPYSPFSLGLNEVGGYVEYFGFVCACLAAMELTWAAWLFVKRSLRLVTESEMRERVRTAATAMTAFHRLYSPRVVAWSSISETLDTGIHAIYATRRLTDCWFIMFALGEVVYDGELNDEG